MKLDSFLPHLLVELPGVSDPLVKQSLVWEAIDFCQQSQVWQELIEPLTLVDEQAVYDLDPPVDAQVYLLLDVWVGARQLVPVTLPRRQLQGTPNWMVSAPYPTHFKSSADRQSLTLYPTPLVSLTALASTLQAKVCYTPKPTATTLPDLLGGRYLRAVCAGVKAGLMAIPDKTWSNPALSAFYRSQFQEGVLQARREMLYDTSVGGELGVPSRKFGF